jgi:hypothetical protein
MSCIQNYIRQWIVSNTVLEYPFLGTDATWLKPKTWVLVSTRMLGGRSWDGNIAHTVRNWLWILKSFRINSQLSTNTMHNALPYIFILYYSTENSYLYQSTRDQHHGTRTFWYVSSNPRSTFFYIILHFLHLVHLYNLNAYTSLYFNFINVYSIICQYINIPFPSCTQMFYKKLSTCYYLLLLRHAYDVSYV